MPTRSGFDLNLLVAFDALMLERNVSRAAAKLGITQPALSHALKRLRATFDDELFIRARNHMQPTARALSLHGPIRNALEECESVLDQHGSFDPTSAKRTFKLSMSDGTAAIVLPAVVTTLRQDAPEINLNVGDATRVETIARLVSGEIDLAIGVFPGLPPDILKEEIYRDSLVCVADQKNSKLRRGHMDFDSYLSCPHVTVAFDQHSGFELDDMLTRLGIKRRIVAVLPHYLLIPLVVRGNDLVGHVRRQFSAGFGEFPGIAVFEPPLPMQIPELSFQQIWHRRKDADPGHRWLRQVIKKKIGANAD